MQALAAQKRATQVMRGGVVDAGGWIRPLTQAFCFNMLEVHALFRAGGE
jgi:hypothetical protein